MNEESVLAVAVVFCHLETHVQDAIPPKIFDTCLLFIAGEMIGAHLFQCEWILEIVLRTFWVVVSRISIDSFSFISIGLRVMTKVPKLKLKAYNIRWRYA